MISEECSFNDELNYTVVLWGDNGTIINQRVISSDSCVNGFCETSFVSTSSNSYVVHVTATNGIGLSSGTVESSTIGMYICVCFTFKRLFSQQRGLFYSFSMCPLQTVRRVSCVPTSPWETAQFSLLRILTIKT